MKKLLITVLSVFLLLCTFGLVACSSGDPYFGAKVDEQKWTEQFTLYGNNFVIDFDGEKIGQYRYDNGSFASGNYYYDIVTIDDETAYFSATKTNEGWSLSPLQYESSPLYKEEVDFLNWVKDNFSEFAFDETDLCYRYTNEDKNPAYAGAPFYIDSAGVIFSQSKLANVYINLYSFSEPDARYTYMYNQFGTVINEYSLYKRNVNIFNGNFTLKGSSPIEEYDISYTEDKIYANIPTNADPTQREIYWHVDNSGSTPKYVNYKKNAGGEWEQDLSRTQAEYINGRTSVYNLFFANMLDASKFEFKNGSLVNKVDIEKTAFINNTTCTLTFKNVVGTLDEGFNIKKITYNVELSAQGASITYSFTLTVGNASITLPNEYTTLNPYVESDITNGLNITDTTFNYSLSVNGATTIVVVDGDAVSKKIGDQTTAIFKQGTKFYTYAVNEYWANSTKYNASTGQNGQGDKIIWDKTYYTPSEIKTDGESQRNAIRDLYKEYIPDLTGKFEQFTFDGEKLVASSIVIDNVTYSDIEISFYGDKTVKSISYAVSSNADDAHVVLISFAYYYREIDKPENLTSYYGDNPTDLVSNAPKDIFLLTGDNFVCFYEDLYGQQNIKIEKAGNVIKYTTYNVQSITREEYYLKDGNDYYKYSKSNGVWSATTCTQADYEAKENLMYTMVCNYNSAYANCKTNYSGFMSSGDIASYYSVAGSSGGAKAEHYIAIYVANDNVEKIVVRGTGSSSKNFYYEFSFEYGTAIINLPAVD